MNHAYAREKLTLLLRDLHAYRGDEFWRQMSRIACGSTGASHAEELAKKLRDEEISHNNTLIERDRAEAAADKLSCVVMGITGRDVGEHSSAHCPWEAAIEHAGEYASEFRSLLIACNTAVRSFEAADRGTDADRLRTALGRCAEGKEEES